MGQKSMKSLASLFIVAIMMMSQSALSCDEQCLRDKAEATLNKKFPRYLTWKECESVANTFMTSVVGSLNDFRTNRMNTKYKGPLKNIRSEIAKQKDWLAECDGYLKATNKKRVFEDDKTTTEIFAAMDKVSEELSALINGATYSSAAGEDPNFVINQRFDHLFKRVDDHKTLMHLKGKYVFR